MDTPNTKMLPTQNVGRDVEARYARQTAAAERRQRSTAADTTGVLGPVNGVLSEVEDRNGRNGRYLRGRLTFTVDGVERNVVALVSNQAIAKTEAAFVAGPVRLYGELRANTFSVIGPVRAGRSRKAAAPIAAAEAKGPAKARRGWWYARQAAGKKAAIA